MGSGGTKTILTLIISGLMVLTFQNCAKAKFVDASSAEGNPFSNNPFATTNSGNPGGGGATNGLGPDGNGEIGGQAIGSTPGAGQNPNVTGDATNEFGIGIDTNVGTPIDINIVNQSCAATTNTEAIYRVSFPNPNVQCEFGKNGNLDERNQYFQARRVQKWDFPLPANATICDIDFDFGEQEFWYDDVIILALNSNILVSSYNFDDRLALTNGFLQYNWPNIVSSYWDVNGRSETYCVGSQFGLSSCSFPAQHDTAPINIDLSPEVIKNAMAASGNIQHSFNFITTGDNDPRTDCQHFDLEFDVKVKYVQ